MKDKEEFRQAKKDVQRGKVKERMSFRIDRGAEENRQKCKRKYIYKKKRVMKIR